MAGLFAAAAFASSSSFFFRAAAAVRCAKVCLGAAVVVPGAPGLADNLPVVPRADVAPEVAVDAAVPPPMEARTPGRAAAPACRALRWRSTSSLFAASSCCLADCGPVRSPVSRLVVVPPPIPEGRPVTDAFPGSGFAGDAFGMPGLAIIEALVGLVGVVSVALFVSSTASFRISSPLGPFLTSANSTARPPSALL